MELSVVRTHPLSSSHHHNLRVVCPPYIPLPDLRVRCEQRSFGDSKWTPTVDKPARPTPTTPIIHRLPPTRPSSFPAPQTMALSRSAKIVFLLILDIIFFFVEIIVGPFGLLRNIKNY